MKKDNVVEFRMPEDVADPLTELLRQGSRRLIQQAIDLELSELLEGYADIRDEHGRNAVVRNGHLPKRDILTGIGPVPVRIPKVRSRVGEQVVFRSSLVPPYVRKARRVEAALPWLYLKGISTGKIREALEVLVGSEARGLSPSVVSRLKREWEAEYEGWRKKDLSKDHWVYLWGRRQFIAGCGRSIRSFACLWSLASMNGARSIFWRLRMACANRPRAGGRCFWA